MNTNKHISQVTRKDLEQWIRENYETYVTSEKSDLKGLTNALAKAFGGARDEESMKLLHQFVCTTSIKIEYGQ